MNASRKGPPPPSDRGAHVQLHAEAVDRPGTGTHNRLPTTSLRE